MQPAQAEGGGSSSNNVKKWGPIGAIVIVVAAIVGFVVVSGGDDDEASTDSTTPATEPASTEAPTETTGDTATDGTEAPAGASEIVYPLSFSQAEEQGIEVAWDDRCDTERGTVAVQFFFAPECYAPFEGDNGGATSRGVTEESIKVP
jgi:hypothetical protein